MLTHFHPTSLNYKGKLSSYFALLINIRVPLCECVSSLRIMETLEEPREKPNKKVWATEKSICSDTLFTGLCSLFRARRRWEILRFLTNCLVGLLCQRAARWRRLWLWIEFCNCPAVTLQEALYYTKMGNISLTSVYRNRCYPNWFYL